MMKQNPQSEQNIRIIDEETSGVTMENFSNYIIHPDGRIWHIIRKRWLKIEGKDYPQVKMYDDQGKPHVLYLHRVIAQNFIGHIPLGYTVNHIDENPFNNHISNLEIVTMKANANHGSRNQRISMSNMGKPKHRHTFTVRCGDKVEEFNTLQSMCRAHPSQKRMTWRYRLAISKKPQETYFFIEDGKVLQITPTDEAFKQRLTVTPSS